MIIYTSEEMGTKVQGKSYLPGYYTTRDLNEDGWPLYYEDAVASGQFYGTYPPRLLNGYTDYNKEALKQTMLDQEAIFRNQVHELHHLYGKQRELMEELKRKEPCHYALQSLSSVPSSSSHNKFTMERERIPSVPRPWDINCNVSSQSGSAEETPEPLKTLNNGNRQASVMLTESGDSLKKSDLNSKLSKPPRGMIDLQLPADVYIDSENEKTDASPTCNVEPGKNMKLTLGYSGNPSQVESWRGSLRLQDAQSLEDLSNLNSLIPINGVSNVASPTFPSNCLRGKAPLEEAQGLQSSLPQQSNSLKMKNFQYLHKSMGLSPMDQQRFSSGSERSNPFVSSFSDKTMLDPHRLGQFKMEKSCDLPSFSMSKHMKMELECKENLSGSSERLRPCIGNTSYSALPCSAPSGPNALVPLSGHLGVSSPLHSSHKNPMDGTPFAPIDVDTLPLFNKSALLNHASNSSKPICPSGYVCSKLPLNKNLTSNQSFDSEVSSYPNGFLHNLTPSSCQNVSPTNFSNESRKFGDLSARSSSIYGSKESPGRLNNKDVKPLKIADLNLDLSTDCPNNFPSQQEMVFREPENKDSKTSGGLPWLKSSPSGKGSNINLNIAINPADLSEQDFGREEHERNPSPDSASTPAKGPKPTSDCPSSKNGFFPVDATYPDGLCRPDLNRRNSIIDLEKPAPVEHYFEDLQANVSSPKDQINLNAMPFNTGRCGLEIDLEAPAVPDIDDDVLCCKETLELDQCPASFENPEVGIDAKADPERQPDGINNAAEIIIDMSSSMCRNQDSIAVDPSDTTCMQSLMWFADVVCSNVDCQGNTCCMTDEDGKEEDFDSEGVDMFELMTLKLAETKPEDYWTNNKQKEREDVNNEEAGFASLLVGKSKRGQARKRRQKRDFQKDILPGLASLSRQEATEDLQAIGGMLRACGQSWEMGLARRNAGRGGTLRSRGGRRARGGGASAKTRTRTTSPTLSIIPNNTDAITGANMMGWGRTRRCRRPRCPSGSAGASASAMPILPRE